MQTRVWKWFWNPRGETLQVEIENETPEMRPCWECSPQLEAESEPIQRRPVGAEVAALLGWALPGAVTYS